MCFRCWGNLIQHCFESGVGEELVHNMLMLLLDSDNWGGEKCSLELGGLCIEKCSLKSSNLEMYWEHVLFVFDTVLCMG